MTVQATRDATAYTRAASKQELIAEAITSIITGRPYPEHLAPTTYAGADCPPATVEDGIGRILAGPVGVEAV